MAAKKRPKKRAKKAGKRPIRRRSLTAAQIRLLRNRAIGALVTQKLGDPCSQADLCANADAVSKWLEWLKEDYQRLRVAVCNVENQAWTQDGDPGLRFCRGNASDEPLEPPPTPKW